MLTLVVLAGLLSLGRWQLERAAQKRALFDAFDTPQDAARVIELDTPPLPRYAHVAARGHYDAARQVLIDNMTSADGRAGYFVVTPFALARGGWLLVNRGWVPVGVSRAALPSIEVSGETRQVRGRTDRLPSPGIHMGRPAPLRPPFPAVANFPSHAELEQLLHETSWARAADLVLLDAAEPDGYERRWQPPGFPPLRHLAYAVQWFALAVALVVIYMVTNFRKVRQ
jgi:surfeit locus 1 family protein